MRIQVHLYMDTVVKSKGDFFYMILCLYHEIRLVLGNVKGRERVYETES